MSKLTIEYENEKFNCFVDGEKLNFITSIYCVGSIFSKNLIISTVSMDDIVNIAKGLNKVNGFPMP